MTTPTLDVLICSLGPDGLHRIEQMRLPHVDGVRYIISIQNPIEIELPLTLRRNDIKVCFVNNVGLSRNRNNALRNSSADLCLIADDDIKYTAEQLQIVIETFAARDKVDIITFRYSGKDNKKNYPSQETDLRKKQQNYWVSSIEIAFRRKSIINNNIRFDERFGLGAPVLCAGEEEVFIHDSLSKGLVGRFVPLTIVTHEGLSTAAKRNEDFSFLMTKGAVQRRIHPCSWPIHCLIAARSVASTTRLSFPVALRHILRGAKYINKQL